ncbi:MAG: glycosyltransferase family 1 protein [Candidatus Kerfeldbacteria bacterium]
MRIGVDCRSLQEPQPSGVSVYTRELLKAMLALEEAKEHEFVFFANERALKDDADAFAKLQKGLTGNNITWNIKTVPEKLITGLEIISSRPGMKWMFGNVDIVFVPSMQFFPLRDRSVPMVVTIHDLSFERYPECLSLKGRWWHRLLQTRRFAHRADSIIAVSEHTRQDIETLYHVQPSRVTTVYPGLPIYDANGEKGATLDLPDQYVLSLSTVEPRKNIDTLLQAFSMLKKKHPKLHLVIVGAEGWKSEPLIKRIALDPRIRHYGYVDQKTKVRLIQSASVFVYPSLYEGFGFPPLEAQSYDIPVLVGAHSSLPEVLEDSALYADVLDARSLSRGIDHLLTNGQLREALIAKGSENIRRFSWETTARKTFDIIQKTAKKE